MHGRGQAAGIARVVAAMRDPNPHAAHGARGCAQMASRSTWGCAKPRRASSIAGFVSVQTRGRPWVRLKVAASLDGRTALTDGQSRWITGEAARADGHRYRARACAVMTGIGTVLSDDPELTVRALATPRQPRRVIVDRHARDPGDGARCCAARGR